MYNIMHIKKKLDCAIQLKNDFSSPRVIMSLQIFALQKDKKKMTEDCRRSSQSN